MVQDPFAAWPAPAPGPAAAPGAGRPPGPPAGQPPAADDDPFGADAPSDPGRTFIRPRPAGWRGTTADGGGPVSAEPSGGWPGAEAGAFAAAGEAWDRANRPSPAGMRAADPGAADPAWAAAAAAAEAAPPDHGLNPLLALANRLLLLVPQIRATRHLADPSALRLQLAQGLRDLVQTAQQQGLAPEPVMAARYVLCTALDEAASETPWGGQGAWARQPLLAEFHNEAFGGEKVFQLMARLAQEPARHLHLLELIHATLALGFQGRWRVQANGAQQREAVMARLAQIIREQRGPHAPALAAHWAGHAAPVRRVHGALPLAVAVLLVALALAGLYTSLNLWLAERADPVLAAVQRLHLSPPVAVAPQPAAQPRLAALLAGDLRAGWLEVRDEIDRSIVVLRGDGLFASGSAELQDDRRALLQRVAQALRGAGAGRVIVTGHTDDTPMRSARFPSNWALSEERARSVAQLLLEAGLPADRVRAEGQADGRPLVPNTSDEGRRRNRRVELTWVPDAAAADGAPRRPVVPTTSSNGS